MSNPGDMNKCFIFVANKSVYFYTLGSSKGDAGKSVLQ
jgi:hypothetical protein